MAGSQQGQYLGPLGRTAGHSSQGQGDRPAWVWPRPQIVTGVKQTFGGPDKRAELRGPLQPFVAGDTNIKRN